MGRRKSTELEGQVDMFAQPGVTHQLVAMDAKGWTAKCGATAKAKSIRDEPVTGWQSQVTCTMCA